MTMGQYASSPGYSTYCYAELAAYFINFLHYCSTSSGLYGAGKDNRGRCTNNPSGCHPIQTISAPTSTDPPFLCRMPFLRQTCQIYPGLGQAPNNAGLHTWWLVAIYQLKLKMLITHKIFPILYNGHWARKWSFQIASSPRGIQAWQLGPPQSAPWSL